MQDPGLVRDRDEDAPARRFKGRIIRTAIVSCLGEGLVLLAEAPAEDRTAVQARTESFIHAARADQERSDAGTFHRALRERTELVRACRNSERYEMRFPKPAEGLLQNRYPEAHLALDYPDDPVTTRNNVRATAMPVEL